MFFPEICVYCCLNVNSIKHTDTMSYFLFAGFKVYMTYMVFTLMKLTRHGYREKIFLGGLLFTVLSSSYCTGIRDVERKIADLAIYTVFIAPASWDSILFQSYIQKRSSKSAIEQSKLVIQENVEQLKKILKESVADTSFKFSLKRLFNKYKNTHLTNFPDRNQFFSGDENTAQAGDMQRVAVEAKLEILDKISKSEQMILVENIKKILFLMGQRTEKKEIWSTYSNVIEKTMQAMGSTNSVKITLDNTAQQFYTEIRQLLLDRKINQHVFDLEKARFNLGGAIYSPGLLIDIAGKLTTEDKDKFVFSLVNSLLQPLIQLKAKVDGSTPENIKEEVIKYLQSVTNSVDVYFLKKEIAESQELRSESICRRIDQLSDKKKVSQKIDQVQMKNTKRMIATLQEANTSLFKDFIIIDREIVSKYTEYIRTGGGDNKLKEELESTFNLF
ncbi:hypothetical protein NEAUS04_1850 [Nematocida ausubeli]|nr:hypothetical protein NEAUS04_1850 [Nematocida ausubeli]